MDKLMMLREKRRVLQGKLYVCLHVFYHIVLGWDDPCENIKYYGDSYTQQMIDGTLKQIRPIYGGKYCPFCNITYHNYTYSEQIIQK